eukprot:CAMPEP_0178963114 /NCGR_PEP_ID=MMETSP0789-20121207/14814_1 /TAXON_ID=3005 /ORGANISM="Rhizosolenia setigera, Strain CCMP 1694" /LENGTH=241 /DNA_ID=CAMNT_0020647487 /DNA_START=48 /DNA_END=773 /DNA_ORIENTATION=+
MNPEDLTISLLDENEVDPEAGRPRYEDDEFEPKPKSLGTIIKESVIFSIALVASVSSLFYMAVSTNNIAYISGVLCCIIAPYSWYQQKDLFEIQKMNDVCESMIKVVEDTQKENNRLQSAVEHLDETQKNMEDVHDILEMVQKSQGKSIKTIGKQIEGNQLILNSIEKNYKNVRWQNILLVMKIVDKNKDALLTGKEIDTLVYYLKQLDLAHFDEKSLREQISTSNGEAWKVMSILKELHM